MTCDWELYMGASLSSLASRDFGSCSLELSEKPTFAALRDFTSLLIWDPGMRVELLRGSMSDSAKITGQ
jgi:hypothetical protein